VNKVHITSVNGITHVYIDGTQIKNIAKLYFEQKIGGEYPILTLEFDANVDVYGEALAFESKSHNDIGNDSENP